MSISDPTQNTTNQGSVSHNSTGDDLNQDSFNNYKSKIMTFKTLDEATDWILSILNADDFRNDNYQLFQWGLLGVLTSGNFGIDLSKYLD